MLHAQITLIYPDLATLPYLTMLETCFNREKDRLHKTELLEEVTWLDWSINGRIGPEPTQYPKRHSTPFMREVWSAITVEQQRERAERQPYTGPNAKKREQRLKELDKINSQIDRIWSNAFKDDIKKEEVYKAKCQCH